MVERLAFLSFHVVFFVGVFGGGVFFLFFCVSGIMCVTSPKLTIFWLLLFFRTRVCLWERESNDCLQWIMYIIRPVCFYSQCIRGRPVVGCCNVFFLHSSFCPFKFSSFHVVHYCPVLLLLCCSLVSPPRLPALVYGIRPSKEERCRKARLEAVSPPVS